MEPEKGKPAAPALPAPGDEEAYLANFPLSHGLTTAESNELLRKWGKNELPDSKKSKFMLFAENLWQPMPILLWVAAIVEFAISNPTDGVILVAINFANATLSFYEASKAGDAVEALKHSLKPTAICKRDGVWDHHFDATKLVPGDLVELIVGTAVPADCILNQGEIECDESAMTGESLPACLSERMMARMGGTVARGETEATVVYTGKNTFFGKTAAMLGGDKGRSSMQKLLLKIMIILVSLSIVFCGICLVWLLVRPLTAREIHDHVKVGDRVTQALSFFVVVLVASVPMAIEIVCITTLAVGARQMSAHGAIVSRLTAIEDLAGMNMLCSDKTGTLTKNKMVIQAETPVFVPGLTQMDLLKYAAMAAKWESPPKDALDTLVLRCHLWCPDLATNPHTDPAQRDAWIEEKLANTLMAAMADYERLDYKPFHATIKRTEGTVRVKSTGKVFRVTKGAPHVLHQLEKDQNSEIVQQSQKEVTAFGEDGVRAMAISVSEPLENYEVGSEPPCVWHLQGLLTFLDPPREDTKDTIQRSEDYGVPVRMITGDHHLIAVKTCKDLLMGDRTRQEWPIIQGPEQLPTLDAGSKIPADLVSKYGKYIENADGFAQVFPEHKFLIVECYKGLGYKTGMTGDGVNDAPALKAADVGIAVAGATDAARAAAAIVLTKEGLSTIVFGMEIARAIFRRMKSFLTYRIAATLQLLFFFFIALFAFPPREYLPDDEEIVPDQMEWPLFFSLPVLMLMIITLLNDGTLCCIGYDNAVAHQLPEKWNLPIMFLVSATMGMVACFSSLLLLFFCLDSWNENSLFQNIGGGGLLYGQVINVIFTSVGVTDFLTLVSARTQESFFWSSNPSTVLWIGACLALSATTLLGLLWPPGTLDGTPVYGLAYQSRNLIALWVWIYCLVTFVIQDFVKVLLFFVLYRFNVFNILGERAEKKKTTTESQSQLIA
jgi:H+-transporting ATPase